MADSIKQYKYHVITVIAVAWCLFQLYTGVFGVLEPLQQRTIHSGFALALVYLMYPAVKSLDSEKIYIDQIIIFSIIVWIIGYMVIYSDDIIMNSGRFTPTEKFMAVALLVIAVDAARRVTGWGLPIISVFFVVYSLLGKYFPSILMHPGLSWLQMTIRISWSIEGLFGVCIDVCSSFIYLFIVYAKILEKTGGGQVFIDLASSLVGHVRGGPAKVAVVASCLFGSISGSAVANVAGTGTFTIPLMKRIGYKPHFAAAVEAVASTGGQFMPPIMGASAFLIAEILSISYWSVAVFALVPALLYYWACFIMVDLEAARTGLKGIDRAELPKFSDVLRDGWPMLLSPVLLVFLLAVIQWSPAKSVVWAIGLTVLICQINPKSRLTLKQYVEVMREGSIGCLDTSICCLTVGIIIACVLQTGLALKLSTVLITIAGGNLPLLLLMTFVSCIIFGMGLPTIACYMVLAMMVAPALIEMGVHPVAAHLFIFYFGIVSNITPPVALASYVAAGIANANFWWTGFTACKLGVVAFVVPFLFVFNPALVGQSDSVLEIIECAVTATIGVYGLSCFLQGYFLEKLSWWQRIIFGVAGISLMIPEPTTDIIGAVLFVFVCAIHIVLNKRKKAALAAV
jgi:TRAP transporter 4TM/12TM fusion protein